MRAGIVLGRVRLAIPIKVTPGHIGEGPRTQPGAIQGASGGFDPPDGAGGGVELPRVGLAVPVEIGGGHIGESI